MKRAKGLMVLGVLLVLFALPLVVGAATFLIPQGMDYVLFVRNLPEVLQLLTIEGLWTDEFEDLEPLPTQIVMFGKVSFEPGKLDLGRLKNDMFDESIFDLENWPLIFLLPEKTSEEAVENFLYLLGLCNPRFEQISTNYWRICDFFGIGVLLKTESGTYITFSKTLQGYLELFAKDRKLSVSVSLPDEPLISYKFFNDSPIGGLLYLLGDVHGRPRHEAGSVTVNNDGSLELKVSIYRDLSELEKKLPGKAEYVDGHTYLAGANFCVSSAGFFTSFFTNLLDLAFPLGIDTGELESFAISAQMTDDGEASSALISLKFKEARRAETLSTLRKMLLGLLVEERDGMIVAKMGEGKVVRIGDILPKNTKLHLAFPFLSLYLTDESSEVTNVHVKIQSLDELLELIESNVDVFVSERDYEEFDGEDWGFDWEEEGDEYTEELTEEDTDWSVHETELWANDLTEKMAEFISSYVWAVAEGDEPDAVALSEEVGLPEETFDVFKNAARDGAIHMLFIFYLDGPDQIYEALVQLTDLLDLPWNASVTSTCSGMKFIVYVTLEQY